MRFIAQEGTPTYQKLRALRIKMGECNTAANELRKSHGWDENVLLPGFSVAGGIQGVRFDEKPACWRLVHTLGKMSFYYPIKGRISTREILAQLEALPTVDCWEYNAAIGADEPFSRFGLVDCGEYFLLQISEHMEFNAPDLEEITVVRYNELKAAKETLSPVTA